MRTSESELVHQLFSLAKVKPIRSIEQFAEEEIVLTSGPHAGLKFRTDRHPVAKLIFAEVESGRWPRMFFTGPNQDGKTLMCFIIVVMWLLFERCERVVLGVPNMDIAADKWNLDLRPAIVSSRYEDLLPEKGGGARGGTPSTIEFKHGPVLRFMTGGGDDQSRASFTAPNVVVTETDGFDEVGSSSREGTKFAQLEKRNLAYDDDEKLTLAECTVSTEAGRTWYEYTSGTQSRIAIKCPHCSEFVTPGREHFSGWQNAESEFEAAELAAVHCPSCGAAWTNDERLEANTHAVLVHKGQTVTKEGKVEGDPPKTSTLGFRWDCINAAVKKDRMAAVAKQEWKAANLADGEAADTAEKDLRQMHWVVPAKSRTSDVRAIEAVALQRRMLGTLEAGVVPDDVEFLTLGVDVGKWLLHWTLLGWRPNASPHVVDYSRVDVPSSSMAEELSIPNALHQLKDRVDAGWQTKEGRKLFPVLALADAGWFQWTVLNTVSPWGEPWFGSKGYGVDQRKSGEYKRDTGSKRLDSGEACALIQLKEGHQLWEFDADYWKGWLHNRMTTPMGEPGAFSLFYSPKQNEHLAFVKHHTNERQVEDFVEGVMRKLWRNPTHLPNHWFDASVLASVAGHIAGARLFTPEPVAVTPPPRPAVMPANFATSYRGKY